MRRYIISHFKEPVDIASSNFNEDTAIFGGGENLKQAITNVTRQYQPSVIGIPSTCLSETIGDDIPLTLREYRRENADREIPELIEVSTPSYKGTHIDGFHGAVKSLVNGLAKGQEKNNCINIFPNMVSPADLRYLKEIFQDSALPCLMLPDYSESLDGHPWDEYQKIPPGGISVFDINRMGSARATIEFGRILGEGESAGKSLLNRYRIPLFNTGLPIGIKETDKFFECLASLSGLKTPLKYENERGRLVDSYFDAHKYIFGKKALIYGEEDLVVGLASFLSEIGIIPQICASGGKSGHLKEKIREVVPDFDKENIQVREGIDFVGMENELREFKCDLLIGHSKGNKISRKYNLPLIRTGFPIHDRIGGQRILHLGYRGAQELFDKIVNTLLEQKQNSSPIGYFYM
jgi:nitrogenase molybdenum-iron protein NifN